MPEVHLTYHETTTGGMCLSDEPYSSREPSYTTWFPISLHTDRETVDDVFPEAIKVAFDPKAGTTVHLVVARYTTGDTFGTSYGNWQIIGVFESEAEAKALDEDINKSYEFYLKSDSDYENAHKYKSEVATPNDPSKYAQWHGYFESLEEVEVTTLTLV